MPNELARLKDGNSAFQERTWKVERIGWCLMGAIIVAGLLGVWAYGPLARTNAAPPGGGYSLTYERFMRHMAPAQLVLEIRKSTGDSIRVTVSSGLREAWDFQRIYPEPDRSLATPDGIRFEFAAAAGGEIIFSMRPNTIGPVSGTFAVAEAGTVQLRHWVYP